MFDAVKMLGVSAAFAIMTLQGSKDHLKASIERGIEFLRRSQLPSGEFKVFMSPDLSLQYDSVFDSSPFPAAPIAYWLGFDDKAIMDVLSKALRFPVNLRARYR